MPYTLEELNRISGSRTAVRLKQYVEANGNIWIGTDDNRLKRVFLRDKNVGVRISDEVTIQDLKTFLIGLNDRIEGLEESFNTIITKNVSTSFNVDPAVNVYYVDCTLGNIIATFDLSTTSDRMILFIRVDNTTKTFSIKSTVVTTLLNGDTTPFDTKLGEWDGLVVTNDTTNMYGTYSVITLLPTTDEKEALDAANSPTGLNPFLTFDDLDEDSTSIDSITALRRQVLINTREIDNLHYLIGLLLFELIEQGVKIESEELINELNNIQ